MRYESFAVLSGNSIQGGAIGSPNNDGSTGTSAYQNGEPFPPDNFNILHTKAGLVSAVRANNKGYIDSRFFVQTENDAGWADGRYAAFGIVLDGDMADGGGEIGNGGMDLVRRISRVDVVRPRNSPKDSVTIVGCGVL
jgi:cyclophilin family peptidyl-prolyl cis-trans isomerase